MDDDERQVFANLPAAMIEEMLQSSTTVGDVLLDNFQKTRDFSENLRSKLVDSGFLIHESQFGYPQLPTTCAADGSYAIERLLSVDFTAAAAVAVEGLTPPSEKRYWEQPHHYVFVKEELHHPDTATVLRAIMLGHEIDLAAKAPHDLIMLDGTLTLPVIYFNQAIHKSREIHGLHCSHVFLREVEQYLEDYLNIIKSERSDKQFVGLPKYSTRREIGKMFDWPFQYNDRSLLTLILKAGELTKPIPLEQPDQAWHLAMEKVQGRRNSNEKQLLEMGIVEALRSIHIIYYRPHEWIPALRLEVAEAVVCNNHRLAILLQGVKYQCATPAMLEPYPLYLADRSVKSVARAMPVFLQVTTQRVAEKYNGDIGEVYMALHGHRTDSGG
jgi:hypothetical protein